MTVTASPTGLRSEAPAPHPTHEVTNQAPPRTGLDEYGTNLPLAEAVRTFGAAWHEPELHEIGGLVGSTRFQTDAELAHTSPPVLRTHDRYGNRVDEVDFHPAYHEIIGAAVRHGAHTAAWADPKPGAAVARAASFMLFAQVEPGHACPMSMSHAVVPVLQRDPEVGQDWLPGLLSRSYDPRLIAPAKQVGADLRHGDDGEAGRLRRPRQHHARGPGRLRPRRPGPSADRSQVVLLGPAVGCLPGSGPGGGRADLLPRTACAGRRHP